MQLSCKFEKQEQKTQMLVGVRKIKIPKSPYSLL